MAGQKGRDVLLKVFDETDFVAVAGVRSKTLQFVSDTVDGTHTESPEAWRELVTGAGIKSARLRGSGVFKDAGSDARIRGVFFDGQTTRWQLIVPDFGVVEGPFQITELAYGGDHDGEATFSITLESAGQITFAETS
ncbi:MAG: phage major tail protein, TP901-1 family [Pseudomonadota bacterium]